MGKKLADGVDFQSAASLHPTAAAIAVEQSRRFHGTRYEEGTERGGRRGRGRGRRFRLNVWLALAWGLLLRRARCVVPVGAVKTQITWVNGIAHNWDHMEEGQSSISSLFGGSPVLFCHNPTAMTSEQDYVGYVGDLTQAGTQKLGRITAEVEALVSHLQAAVEQVGPRGRVLHIAHSQGALITYLACRRLSADLLQQIEVVGFGGAAALLKTKETPFCRCVNYYSMNDPLLYVVPTATKALRSGFLGGAGGMPSLSLSARRRRRRRGNNNNNNNGGSGGAAQDDHDAEFVFLTPRAGDPVVDHGLFGPTYVQALAWEGRRYQALYVPWLYRTTRAGWLSTVAVLAQVQQYLLLLQALVLQRLEIWGRWLATYLLAPLLEWVQHLLWLLRLELHSWSMRHRRHQERFEPVPASLWILSLENTYSDGGKKQAKPVWKEPEMA